MIHVELLIFDGVDLLDVGGPYEVLLTANRLLARDGSSDLFDVRVGAAGDGPYTSYGGLRLLPSGDAVERPVDVFVVPGAVDISHVASDLALIDLIARRASTAGVTASVCTGALLLAHAGLINGVTATTHHEDVADLAQLIGSDHAVTATWVDAGAIVTSGGLSAGIAMGLHLVDRFGSRELAQRTALQLAYAWGPDDGVVVDSSDGPGDRTVG